MVSIRQLWVVFFLFMLTACGGGGTLDNGSSNNGGNNNGNVGTNPVFTLSLIIRNNQGEMTNQLSSATPLVVEAKLSATNNGVISGRLIDFSFDKPDLAIFDNDAGSSATNVDGIATIGIKVGDLSGAGKITATFGEISAEVVFISAGDGDSDNFTLSLSIKNAQGETTNQLSLATPLIIEASLSATTSGVVEGRLINFSFDKADLANFDNDAGSAATNANGVATIGIKAGTLSGAGIITATFGEISAEVVFNSAGDGGSDAGETIGSVFLIADKLQLGSADTDQIELSALVRNTSNNVISAIPVVFTTDSGELQIIDTETAANGIARASLTTRSDKSNREITVTARVQQQTSELVINVIGTQIEISAPQAVVLNDSAELDIFIQDSEGNGIEGVVVNITSSLGNALSSTNPITVGSSGKASITYTAVSSGVDSILVTALGSQRIATLNVSPDSFAFLARATESSSIEEVPLNSPQRLELQWLVNDLPNIGQNVTFATSRGFIAGSVNELAANNVSISKQTDSSGLADVFIQSRFAGLATIAAQAGVGESSVNAQKTIEFIAVTPSKIEVQAFPAQVGPGEQSTVRAILRDALNNPVKNRPIVFTLDNAAGGQLSTVRAVTNSAGVATTLFTADVTTGAGVNGLNLQVKGSLDESNISGFTDIAVGNRTLFFRFGTGNVIEKPSASLYSKEFSVIVTDSSGNPVPNQQLNVAVVPVAYAKGEWVASPPVGEFKFWSAQRNVVCPNEDVNLDGILEVSEDTNGDGQITPGNLATVPRTVTADADGIAVFNVRYPQDSGAWLDVRLQVSGFAAGTENVAFREYQLPVSADDVTNETSPPPSNPFGRNAVCTDTN